MKHKILTVAVILLISGAAGVYSLGLGVQAGGQGNWDNWHGEGRFSFLISPSERLHIALSLSGDFDNYLAVGGSFDWWALNLPLAGGFNLFFGPGLGFDVGWQKVAGASTHFWLLPYLRLPVGVNFKIQFVELFAQVVPSWGMHLDLKPFHAYFNGGGLGGYVGARFWF